MHFEAVLIAHCDSGPARLPETPGAKRAPLSAVDTQVVEKSDFGETVSAVGGLKSVMAEIVPLTTSLDLAVVEDRLKRAFVARYGVDVGLEVTADAMAWAWSNRIEVADAINPLGLLYRVGQSRSRRYLRWRRAETRAAAFPAEHRPDHAAWIEPGLDTALAELDGDHRTAVVLVYCFQWTYPEVAELLEVPLHTVRNRVHRGLARLRTSLGVEQ